MPSLVPAHHSDHFRRELEWGALKLDATWRDIETESEVDVQDVALVVDHDIAIMPVLELQQIAHNAVCCHRFDKFRPRLLEAHRVLTSVFRNKVIVKSVHGLSAQEVSGYRIRQDVDYTAAWRGGCDAVRVDVDVETSGVEDASEYGDHL